MEIKFEKETKKKLTFNDIKVGDMFVIGTDHNVALYHGLYQKKDATSAFRLGENGFEIHPMGTTGDMSDLTLVSVKTIELKREKNKYV